MQTSKELLISYEEQRSNFQEPSIVESKWYKKFFIKCKQKIMVHEARPNIQYTLDNKQE